MNISGIMTHTFLLLNLLYYFFKESLSFSQPDLFRHLNIQVAINCDTPLSYLSAEDLNMKKLYFLYFFLTLDV